jgi:uncharacterized membrane protein
MRKAVNVALTALIALVMIAGGGAHLAAPAQFAPLVPAFLPASPILFVTGVLQVAVGLVTLWPRTRAWGALAFAVVCLGYLPLHLWDFVRSDPVFAPPVAATVRLLVQLLFIAAGWTLFRRTRSP